MICESEKQAVRQVLRLADQWGYGNMIAWLRRAWADNLMEDAELSEETADRATNSSPYPVGWMEMIKDGKS